MWYSVLDFNWSTPYGYVEDLILIASVHMLVSAFCFECEIVASSSVIFAGCMLCLVVWSRGSSLWWKLRTRRWIPTTDRILMSGYPIVGSWCLWKVWYRFDIAWTQVNLIGCKKCCSECGLKSTILCTISVKLDSGLWTAWTGLEMTLIKTAVHRCPNVWQVASKASFLEFQELKGQTQRLCMCNELQQSGYGWILVVSINKGWSLVRLKISTLLILQELSKYDYKAL